MTTAWKRMTTAPLSALSEEKTRCDIIKEPSVKHIALVLALIAIAVGVYSLFRTRGFQKTTATIVSIETTWNFDEEEHTVTVEYTVDGTNVI